MAWIPSATFRMGSDAHYAEEAPSHHVTVDGFWIDRHEVTNRQFAAFVDDTGYVTVAERPLDPLDFPGAPAENLVPGSLVFTRTRGPVDLRHLNLWWTWTPGACWKHPEGPAASLAGREEHPVVHVAYEDACTYSAWGRESAADRVSMGAGCPRRTGGRRLRLGRRARAGGRDAGQLLARRLPLASRTWVRDHGPRRLLPTQRPRTIRHGRQRLGMDSRLVHGAPPRGRRQACRTTHAAAASRTASTPPSRSSPSRARSSRAARSCAPTATACATDPQHDARR
jgi:hypothetical protein